MIRKKKLKSKFLVFGKPDVGEVESKAVADVIASGWLSTGPMVQLFQNEFEKFIGGGYAVAVDSGSQALISALTVANIGKGKEVLIPAMTFSAVINAVLRVGAKPVFVDITRTGHLSPDLIQHAITPQTAAIIAVHHSGEACDMEAIHVESMRYGLTVIEDAAHAFGGCYYGQDGRAQKIGTISDYTCFSFYPTKNITCGEGGIVVCKDPVKAARIKTLVLQGLTMGAWKRYGRDGVCNYQIEFPGHKGNMSDIHAAIGMAQLSRWPEMKSRRAKVWSVYEEAFGKKKQGHAQNFYEIRHKKRDALREYLHVKGIGTGIHFRALHMEPGYKFLKYTEGEFPMAAYWGEHILSLPVSSTMEVEDAKQVVKEVRSFGLN